MNFVNSIIKIDKPIVRFFVYLRQKVMNEDFLHYVWKYQLFSKIDLQTVKRNSLQILKVGTHNHNAGPDFLNAQIHIDNQLWVGNIEIHINSSDWYLHNHELDVNYDAVILHVVWENDASVFMKNNKKLPTLSLKEIILSTALNNYQNLFSSQQRWIPCENEIKTVSNFVFENWKERLFLERLERKAIEMKSLLESNTHDFETTLFHVLAKNFGLKVNADVFLRLAQSIDFKVLRKVSCNITQLEALFFGQAGFLEDDIEEVYYIQLQKEYRYLQHKHNLSPIAKHQFSFFRMRPNNFPTIRIAQLLHVYYRHQNLFSKILEINDLDSFYNLFAIEMNHFWKHHYTFEKESKLSSKKLTKQFINLLLINTVLPLKFLYKKNRGEVTSLTFLDLMKEIPQEKNNIIAKFKDLEITAKSAYDTQALLELKNTYCTKKRCLHCAIGMQILKQ